MKSGGKGDRTSGLLAALLIDPMIILSAACWTARRALSSVAFGTCQSYDGRLG